ncbi:glycosyltransferase [Roseateles sp. DXS20W]|uniref:Glycosyltransferase n=1 Tax=Pelomonas lactea TaxID=3299030 RepID=A0ABW7GFH1_9BURK
MRPLKLLILFDNLELSGTHRVALNLMDAATAAQIDCRALVCMSDKTGLSDTDPRIVWPEQARRRTESLFAKLRKTWVALREATRLARDSDCLVGTCPPSSLVAWWAGWRSGKPAVGWVHYDIDGRRRERAGATTNWLRDSVQNLLYYRFIPRLPRLVCVSESTLASMVRQRGARPPGWAHLPNLYVRGAFAAQSTALPRLRALRAVGEPVILVLGRIVRQKRWEDALAAAVELHGLGQRVQWAFVGDGPEREQFEAACRASPVRDRLHWLGADPNPRPLFAECDALVMTSLYEAWPTVILEAFDLGLPVVAYDCPSGPAEMLGGGERGWVTREEPRALAQALAERLGPQGRDEALRRAAAGRAYLEEFLPARALPLWRAYLERTIAAAARD